MSAQGTLSCLGFFGADGMCDSRDFFLVLGSLPGKGRYGSGAGEQVGQLNVTADNQPKRSEAPFFLLAGLLQILSQTAFAGW